MSDYLDPTEWLELAKQLDLGQRAMHEHSCGSGRKLLVEHAEAGYKAWCYRCSMSGFIPHPKPSLAERIAALKIAKQADEREAADPRPPMPADFEPRNWPSYAKVWLYKSGLSNEDIKANGIYWCDRIKRVVIPVLDGLKLCYWQARGFDPDRAKYINPMLDKPVYKTGPQSDGPLCLTEDILSAIKVGKVCRAWSILGTSLTASVAVEIARLGVPVLIWLDDDEAGIKGRRKIAAALRALGVEVRIIRGDRDPKNYSREEIKELLGI